MDTTSTARHRQRPLDGLRVVEVGQLLAGPFAGTVLAYFGAEVIKVEAPGAGDAVRGWRVVRDGTSLWWRSLARNKKCITVDLRKDEGCELVRRIAERSDVLIENFRPGTMESWDLGPTSFGESNPGLVYARISGYGQTGPYSGKPGYASVCEGIGGLRYVNGVAGERPVRPNLSLGDSLAGLHAALGIIMALYQRDAQSQGTGQVVDVALYEAVFNMLEAVVPEYDGAGVIREPSGSTVTGIVPTNTYRCSDGRYVIIGGNGDSIYKRLMAAAGRVDLAHDPRLASNSGRVTHEAEIDAALSEWTATLTVEDVLDRLETARVPAGPIYSVADMMVDPHFQARGMFESVEINGQPLKIPAMSPRLTETPGRTDWPGAEVGAHNDEILGGLLGLAAEDIERLRDSGII